MGVATITRWPCARSICRSLGLLFDDQTRGEFDSSQGMPGGGEVLRHLGKLLKLLLWSAALDVVRRSELLKAGRDRPRLRQGQHTLEVDVTLHLHSQRLYWNAHVRA